MSPRIRPGSYVGTLNDLDDRLDAIHAEQILVMSEGHCSGGCDAAKLKRGWCYPHGSAARKVHESGVKTICSQSRLPCPMAEKESE